MLEIWKPVKNYESYYEVSNLGRVRGLCRDITNNFGTFKSKDTFLKGYKSVNGYTKYTLSINGKQKTLLGHRMVAEAFLENYDNKPIVNHKNGIKSDNRLDNLEWATGSENMKHAIDTGLIPIRKGEDIYFAKITNYQASLIKGMYHHDNLSVTEISKCTGINRRSIADLIAERTWKHIEIPSEGL